MAKGMVIPGASFASTMAGWHEAAALNSVSSPAVAYHSPLLDAGALAFDLLKDLGDALESLGWRSLCAEELAELLSLLVVVRRVPGDVGGLAIEEVWVEIKISNCFYGIIASKTKLKHATSGNGLQPQKPRRYFFRVRHSGTGYSPGMNTWYW